jgi:hypothetical protein
VKELFFYYYYYYPAPSNSGNISYIYFDWRVLRSDTDSSLSLVRGDDEANGPIDCVYCSFIGCGVVRFRTPATTAPDGRSLRGANDAPAIPLIAVCRRIKNRKTKRAGESDKSCSCQHVPHLTRQGINCDIYLAA